MKAVIIVLLLIIVFTLFVRFVLGQTYECKQNRLAKKASKEK